MSHGVKRTVDTIDDHVHLIWGGAFTALMISYTWEIADHRVSGRATGTELGAAFAVAITVAGLLWAFRPVESLE